MNSMVDNISILNQIGLSLDANITIERSKSQASTSGNIAIKALCQLVRSGKISIDDAKLAVQSSQSVIGEADKTCAQIRGRNNKKKTKQPKLPEVYRTRHISIQFSYDGTEFSGFAENVGHEGDNSVERALFVALEKTRLLVSPEENGMFVLKDERTGYDDDIGGAENSKDLSKNDKKPSKRNAAQYSRCGRTDKGVHAHGQVVAMYLKSAFPLSAKHKIEGVVLTDESLPKNSLDEMECFVQPKMNKQKAGGEQTSYQRKAITEYDYARILNNILPQSIRVLGWCPVSTKFSARFSCSQRTYRYFFPRRNLNLEAMAKGLQFMIGRHDFRNMCKMNCEQVYNFERVIMFGKIVNPLMVYSCSQSDSNDTVPTLNVMEAESSLISSPHDICYLILEGQAFLWHQIRCIMAILFLVGRELEPPTIVQELLDIKTNPAKPAYDMSSETALVLHNCKFDHLNLGRTVANLWSVTKVIEQRWESHAVAASRANDELESMKSDTQVRWTDIVQFVMNVAKERRQKEQKRTLIISNESDIQHALDGRNPQSSTLSWGDAVKIIQDVLSISPHPPNGMSRTQKGLTESTIHVPLMQRSMGTTYEEKVQSIVNGQKNGSGKSKRRERYEDNVIKKRKTSKEDKAFYDKMLRQGGSSI